MGNKEQFDHDVVKPGDFQTQSTTDRPPIPPSAVIMEYAQGLLGYLMNDDSWHDFVYAQYYSCGLEHTVTEDGEEVHFTVFQTMMAQHVLATASQSLYFPDGKEAS